MKKWILTHRIVHKSIGNARSQFLGIVHDLIFTHNFTVSSPFQVVDPSFWRESQYLSIWHHLVENTEIYNFHEHAYPGPPASTTQGLPASSSPVQPGYQTPSPPTLRTPGPPASSTQGLPASSSPVLLGYQTPPPPTLGTPGPPASSTQGVPPVQAPFILWYNPAHSSRYSDIAQYAHLTPFFQAPEMTLNDLWPQIFVNPGNTGQWASMCANDTYVLYCTWQIWIFKL